MRVSIIGSGYVGLVTGACLAERGHRVTCVDVDPTRVQSIRRGQSPIFEAGLDELLRRNVRRSLDASTDLKEAVINSEITLIAVGTPFDGADIDLEYIRIAAAQIGEALRNKAAYHVVVVKSTVVPGTTENVVLPILERASGKHAGSDFGVGMNPEFLREGSAVQDFMMPDRIVLGAADDRTHDCMAMLYAPFLDADVLRTTLRTAEMIKYATNSLLATLISFSNEIGNLCAAIGGVDAVEVMQGVHLDKRIAPISEGRGRVVPAIVTYLEAGCGFGGSCFPKDVSTLIAHARKAGRAMPLLEAVMRINEDQPGEVLVLLRRHFTKLAGVRVAVLGLAFKPGTDDVRHSPALRVIEQLLAENANVVAHDPVANNEAAKHFVGQNVCFCDSLRAAIVGAEAVLVLTRWDEYRSIPELLLEQNTQPVLIDGRRLLNRDTVALYEGIGLGL